MKKLIFISLICLMAVSAFGQTDSIGSLDTTAGSAAWANSAGFYKGGEWTATSTGTLDSMAVIFQLSGATGLKYCIIRSIDSTIVDSTIIDTFGPDTATFVLAFVGHDTIKTDSSYILMIHAGSSPYLLLWNWSDSSSAYEEYFTESSHGQPGTNIWEDPISGLALGSTGKPRMKAYYTTGGEPAVDTVTSRYRNGDLRSGKFR